MTNIIGAICVLGLAVTVGPGIWREFKDPDRDFRVPGFWQPWSASSWFRVERGLPALMIISGSALVLLACLTLIGGDGAGWVRDDSLDRLRGAIAIIFVIGMATACAVGLTGQPQELIPHSLRGHEPDDAESLAEQSE